MIALKPHTASSLLRFFLLFLFFAGLVSCNETPKADIIYYNAKIWTGDSLNERATSIAIKDSLIVYVGLDYTPFKGPGTRLVDLQGKFMVPGFIDNHTHFLQGGNQLASIDLRHSDSRQGFVSIIRKYADSVKGDRWIMWGDWDHEAWGGYLPRKEWIDSVSGQHPVWINRYDGHMALANSIVLKMAGINKNSPNPKGGEIVRDAQTGEPTGVLKDAAMDLVTNIIPPQTAVELQESLHRAIQHALAHGVTQVHDMGSIDGWTDLATYQAAYAHNQLDIRVYSFVPIATWSKLDSFVKQNGWGNDHLRWGGLKGFADGSLGSTTAWFYQPYLDAPQSTGLQVTDTSLLRQWITSADSAGLHVTTHAIGDHAIDFILSVYQGAMNRNGTKDRRFRIEHAQHCSAAAIPAFNKLGVIPSMQPYHAIDDGRWAYKRLDSARLKRTYAFHSIYATGANLCFGSDWTVAPLDPIAGIYAAVTRSTLDDKNPNGWFPEEKMTVEEALKCYTANNAYAGFQENRLGKLKAGMLADLVVLSRDLTGIEPKNIRETTVLLTMVNGKEAYTIPANR